MDFIHMRISFVLPRIHLRDFVSFKRKRCGIYFSHKPGFHT